MTKDMEAFSAAPVLVAAKLGDEPDATYRPDSVTMSEQHRAGGSASLASALRDYGNRWVALQRNRVLTDQDSCPAATSASAHCCLVLVGSNVATSFSDTVEWLRASNIKADAVFLVPEGPEQLLAGLAEPDPYC
jgi:hypothetical protein